MAIFAHMNPLRESTGKMSDRNGKRGKERERKTPSSCHTSCLLFTKRIFSTWGQACFPRKEDSSFAFFLKALFKM